MSGNDIQGDDEVADDGWFPEPVPLPKPPPPPPAKPGAVLQRAVDAAWVQVGEEVVVHRATEKSSVVLNSIAGLVWQCLDGESLASDILVDVAEAFAVDVAIVVEDFLPVLGGWVAAGIAHDETGPLVADDAEIDDFAAHGRRRLDAPPNVCGKAEVGRWPHHLVLGLGDMAIAVASDRPSALEPLALWRIESEPQLIDYVLELDPQPLERQTNLRRLPSISHGCDPLFRLRDEPDLRTAFYRLLASFRQPPPGEVRLALMPIVRDGQALLLPATHAGAVSHRAYAGHSLQPVYTGSCLIDLEAWTVRVDEPLVGPDNVAAGDLGHHPILDWWLPSADPTVGITAGEALAHLMRLSMGVAPETASAVLAGLARLVEQHLPGLAPVPPDRLLEELDRHLADELRGELLDGIVERFALG